MEEQLITGVPVRVQPTVVAPQVQHESARVMPEAQPAVESVELPVNEEPVPIGFWTDIAAAVRKEMNPAMSGFFVTTPNAPIRGILAGDKLILACDSTFVVNMVNKPDILELVARKASAKLGRPLRVVVTDDAELDQKNEQMEQLLNFGRAHGDIIKIRDSE